MIRSTRKPRSEQSFRKNLPERGGTVRYAIPLPPAESCSAGPQYLRAEWFFNLSEIGLPVLKPISEKFLDKYASIRYYFTETVTYSVLMSQ